MEYRHRRFLELLDLRLGKFFAYFEFDDPEPGVRHELFQNFRDEHVGMINLYGALHPPEVAENMSEIHDLKHQFATVNKMAMAPFKEISRIEKVIQALRAQDI